jgi:hypothetical protein
MVITELPTFQNEERAPHAGVFSHPGPAGFRDKASVRFDQNSHPMQKVSAFK